MTTNAFDAQVANIRASQENRRLTEEMKLERLKLAWEIAQKGNGSVRVDKYLSDVRRAYQHITETVDNPNASADSNHQQ